MNVVLIFSAAEEVREAGITFRRKTSPTLTGGEEGKEG